MMADNAPVGCRLVRVCKVVTPNRGGVEHRSFLQLRFIHHHMQEMGYSQALSTGIYAVVSPQGTGEPAFADDLPHE
jgi:hypothetical protein